METYNFFRRKRNNKFNFFPSANCGTRCFKVQSSSSLVLGTKLAFSSLHTWVENTSYVPEILTGYKTKSIMKIQMQFLIISFLKFPNTIPVYIIIYKGIYVCRASPLDLLYLELSTVYNTLRISLYTLHIRCKSLESFHIKL